MLTRRLLTYVLISFTILLLSYIDYHFNLSLVSIFAKSYISLVLKGTILGEIYVWMLPYPGQGPFNNNSLRSLMNNSGPTSPGGPGGPQGPSGFTFSGLEKPETNKDSNRRKAHFDHYVSGVGEAPGTRKLPPIRIPQGLDGQINLDMHKYDKFANPRLNRLNK